MSPERDEEIPTLTEVVSLEPRGIAPEVMAALHADLTAAVTRLTEELLHAASREMEGVLFERVCDRLRDRLPEIVDRVLKERLG
jgi:hypothetical protein